MYQLVNDPKTNKQACIRRISDNAYIPFDPQNSDYQAYLKWVADGETPLPAESN